MKSNQANMRNGVCKYCGQIRMVKSEALTPQDDVDALASKECDCFDAKAQRNQDRKYEKARCNIDIIFKNDPETAEILNMAARKIADDKIDGIAVKCGRMTAKISGTAKGTIKVTKQEKDESSLED